LQARSRSAAKAARGVDGALSLETDDVASLIAENLPFTNDAGKYEWAPPSAPSKVKDYL